MSESKNSFIPDIIEPISNAIQQNIPETAKQTDGALSTVVGFFNNVVLYPVKKANLTFKYKLEAFEDDLKEKIKDIPTENLQIPPVKIAGPVLESLRYAYDEEELREMYEEMLATAMDNRKVHQVHRSYVDAVKQMEPLDAQVLRRIYDNGKIVTVHVKIYLTGNEKNHIDAMPYHYSSKLTDLGDPFQISASISNLLRLGLVISKVGSVNPRIERQILDEAFVQERRRIYSQVDGSDVSVSVSQDCDIISLDSYGRNFVDICMPK